MSEEQLKAAETEATAEQEDVEDILEEDFEGVAGGTNFPFSASPDAQEA